MSTIKLILFGIFLVVGLLFVLSMILLVRGVEILKHGKRSRNAINKKYGLNETRDLDIEENVSLERNDLKGLFMSIFGTIFTIFTGICVAAFLILLCSDLV